MPTAVLEVRPASGTAPLTVTASAEGSSDPEGPLVGAQFGWGDNQATATSGLTAEYTYSSPGTYVVTLFVRDSGGQASLPVFATVVVHAPAPTFTATFGGALLFEGGVVSSTSPGVSCDDVACTGTYATPTVVTITAVPDGAHYFDRWSAGPCAGQGSTCTFLVDAESSFAPLFGWFAAPG